MLPGHVCVLYLAEPVARIHEHVLVMSDRCAGVAAVCRRVVRRASGRQQPSAVDATVVQQNRELAHWCGVQHSAAGGDRNVDNPLVLGHCGRTQSHTCGTVGSVASVVARSCLCVPAARYCWPRRP